MLPILFDGNIFNHADGVAHRSDPHQSLGTPFNNHPAIRCRKPTPCLRVVVFCRYHPVLFLSSWKMSMSNLCSAGVSGFNCPVSMRMPFFQARRGRPFGRSSVLLASIWRLCKKESWPVTNTGLGGSCGVAGAGRTIGRFSVTESDG